ncbi:hypothetical protein [Arcticibacterium luteifluviistationis]|uniref:Uncharacterized protein n=1 Tax=Arcticibacterium luteifluviistationis TaxID=1784714 RepID=A0A2Z4G6E7_9BACT|nr:hypothetical protein [Arcticibacterium luteifluviistationis]AWV96725.1 hypothetical protein DJ013_00365 [Arcticibacterium luteifluviistationis]
MLKKEENHSTLVAYQRNVYYHIQKGIKENRDTLGSIQEALDASLANWKTSIEGNLVIPEINIELDKFIGPLQNKVELVINQNGEIVARIKKIEERVSRTKVLIQGISPEALRINVSDKHHEIANSFQSFKSLLEQNETGNFEYEGKAYHINDFDNNSFDYFTGFRAFNELLTKSIIETIAPECEIANKFLIKANTYSNWEVDHRISDVAKEIIVKSFVGVIGNSFGKLMAIGKENFSDIKQSNYILRAINIVSSSLDLIIFAFLSEFWNAQKLNNKVISEGTKKVIRDRLESSFEPSLMEQFKLLQLLHIIFYQAGDELDFPIPEIKNLNTKLRDGGEIFEICRRFQTLVEKTKNSHLTRLDCYESETQLVAFFKHFNCLAKYKMASIRRISYLQVRNENPNYIHHYAAIGINNKANVDSEKINFTTGPVSTDAVLLYKGKDYQNSINLSPFVIDYNSLTFENGTKICFYNSQTIDGGSLKYHFLEDNSSIDIEKMDSLYAKSDINDLMMDENKRKQFNLGLVVHQFKDAHRFLLMDELNLGDF